MKLDALPEFERDYAGALQTFHIDTSKNSDKQMDMFPAFGGILHADRFALSVKGLTTVKNILRILAREFPHLEYCPSLPSIVSIILHHLSPDDTLASARVMLKQSIDSGQQWMYFPTSLAGTMSFYNAFAELLQRHAPKVSKHLKHLEMEFKSSPFWIKWLDNFLLDIVSLQTSFRLMDSYMVEGYKVVFRYGVGAFLLREASILKTKTMDEVDALFESNPFNNANDDELSRVSFGFSFSRTHVDKINQKETKAKAGATRVSQDAIDNLAIDQVLPILRTPSKFLKDEQWSYVWSWIHKRYRHMSLDLAFSTERHGSHIGALYKKCENQDPQLMFIETMKDEVFGAFLSDSWDKNTVYNKFFGNAETFVFSLLPRDGVYPWVGTTLPVEATHERRREIAENGSLFMFGNSEYLAIGGGGTRNAITLDRSLVKGTTGRCLTFENPPLTNDGQETFEVRQIEVFTFHT